MGQLPRSEKQLEHSRKLGQAPKTEKQLENARKMGQASQKAHPSFYEKKFKKALEHENILFKWQVIIDFPEGSFIKFAIADFLVNKNMIVEIDGKTHQLDPSYDIERDEICKNLGYKILRFTHKEIEKDLKKCITTVKILIQKMTTKKKIHPIHNQYTPEYIYNLVKEFFGEDDEKMRQ